MVNWRDDKGEPVEAPPNDSKNSDPKAPHPNEESRTNLRCVANINPDEESLDEAQKEAVQAEVERLEQAQCHHTSHCTSDEYHIVKGRQTLFANAAVKTIDGQNYKQWPFVVDLELPRFEESDDNSSWPNVTDAARLAESSKRWVPPHQRQGRSEGSLSKNQKAEAQHAGSKGQWRKPEAAVAGLQSMQTETTTGSRSRNQYKYGNAQQHSGYFSSTSWRLPSRQSETPRPSEEMNRDEAGQSGTTDAPTRPPLVPSCRDGQKEVDRRPEDKGQCDEQGKKMPDEGD